MKKYVLSVIVASLFVCLFSCAANRGETVTKNGGAYAAEIDPELFIANRLYENPKAPSSVSAEILGDNVTLSYSGRSFDSALYNCDYDEYTYKSERGERYSLYINTNTGESAGYGYCFVRGREYESKGMNLDRDRCYDIALQKLSELADKDLYSLTFERRLSADGSGIGDAFAFSFTRRISGFTTMDVIDICVNSDGIVCSVDMRQTAAYAGIESVDVDNKILVGAIEHELRELYSKDVPYEIVESRLIKLENGSTGVLYDVRVDAGSEEKDALSLFVYLLDIIRSYRS